MTVRNGGNDIKEGFWLKEKEEEPMHAAVLKTAIRAASRRGAAGRSWRVRSSVIAGAQALEILAQGTHSAAQSGDQQCLPPPSPTLLIA